MKTQKEILSSLTEVELDILNKTMSTEQSYLYITDLKQNRAKEKEVIERIINNIKKVVKNEN